MTPYEDTDVMHVPGDAAMWDVEAERYLLSAMMAHPSAVESAIQLLVEDHFYRPAHQVIFHACVVMHAAEQSIDPVTLRTWIERDGDIRALGGPHGGEYLNEVMALWAAPQSATYYARIVHEHAVRRAIVEAARHMIGDALAVEVPPAVAAGDAIDKIRRAVRAAREPVSVTTLTEFLDHEYPGGDWVVPGLLGRQERVVVVGPEGAGKTMLSHQIGYAIAAGCHPFSWRTAITPRRVVIMDFENPPTLLQRRSRAMAAIAEQFPGWNPANIMIHSQPGGADMLDAIEVFDLAQVVKAAEPDLVIAGPIYKLAAGDEDHKLEAQRKIAAFFDQARTRFNCAIWLEAHAPLGTAQRRVQRPEGSNIWGKWPEFGLTLERDSRRPSELRVGQYRGHREEGRAWPSLLTRSAVGWPWAASYDRDVFPSEAPSEV